MIQKLPTKEESFDELYESVYAAPPPVSEFVVMETASKTIDKGGNQMKSFQQNTTQDEELTDEEIQLLSAWRKKNQEEEMKKKAEAFDPFKAGWSEERITHFHRSGLDIKKYRLIHDC